MISRAELLAVIRNVQSLQLFVASPDDQLLLDAGIVPWTALSAYISHLHPETSTFKSSRYDSFLEWFESDPKSPFVELLQRKKIVASSSGLYIRPNPKDRSRLVATQYDIAKPNLNPGQTYKTPYSIKGRNRLLLWYAAANYDLSGSRGEARGLEAILTFFRKPNVQRMWRRHIQRPFRIPEDAR